MQKILQRAPVIASKVISKVDKWRIVRHMCDLYLCLFVTLFQLHFLLLSIICWCFILF